MTLTENELTICRATGAKWVARDDDPTEDLVRLYITEERPPQNISGVYGGYGKVAIMAPRAFPSLERGDCIKVPGE